MHAVRRTGHNVRHDRRTDDVFKSVCVFCIITVIFDDGRNNVRRLFDGHDVNVITIRRLQLHGRLRQRIPMSDSCAVNNEEAS